ncbi:MAG TPA: hypothetical protein VG326_18350 [Tepidisphaeraceae bacterium]|jgi:hypothetical protein|nr:hypothetical protein [Tepidisphaeraceae bacterium]
MSNAAKVQDVEALKEFRLALLTFAEKATNAVGEADSEVQRVTSWVENEQTTHWSNEQRKRQAAVVKAKEDLRFKQLFKSPSGGKQSTVDEEKTLATANRRLAEADQKILNVKKSIRLLHKEAHMYKGSVQRLASTVAVDIPNAAAKIQRMLIQLEAYLSLAAPNLGPAVEGGEGSGASMSQGTGPQVGGYKRLRQTTPDGPTKDSAPAVVTGLAPWRGGDFAAGDSEALDKLDLELQPADLASTVILAIGVGSASKIYLERSAGSYPGDSGWYIGPADMSKPDGYESVRVEQLLQVRPHFAGLLALPVGTLAVIDTAGIGAVLNAGDEETWTK